MTPEQQMVDRLIDCGLVTSPDVDWTLLLAHEVAVLLPSRGSYRGCEIVTFAMAQPAVVLTDPAGVVDAFYLNLITGDVGGSPNEVGLPPG